MIVLKGVTVSKPDYTTILRNLSLTIGPKERVGILAAPGSGKSTLARIFAGIEPPWAGTRLTTVSVSWPLGYAGFLHPNLTVAHNLRLLGQLNGREPAHYTATVGVLAEIDSKLHCLVRDLTPTERAVVAYMCAMAVPKQMLVADDMLTVGTPKMRLKCEALVQQHLEQGGLIFLSRNPRQIGQYCDRYFVLAQRHLIPCTSLKTAQTLLMKENALA